MEDDLEKKFPKSKIPKRTWQQKDLGPEEKAVRKRLAQGTGQPRNEIEAHFFSKFGTITPIPDQTLRRSRAAQQAAILYIHYNVPMHKVLEITGTSESTIHRYKTEDNWDEFQHYLLQDVKPSALSLIPQRDMKPINKEMERRRGQVAKLVEKENKLVELYSKMQPGVREARNLLSEIKDVRDLINKSIGLDDHLAEIHAVKKVHNAAQVRKLVSSEETPAVSKQARGQIVEL